MTLYLHSNNSYLVIINEKIGDILSALILVETGDIKRFKQVGNYASYCRRVQAIRSSNNKIKARPIGAMGILC